MKFSQGIKSSINTEEVTFGKDWEDLWIWKKHCKKMEYLIKIHNLKS